MAKNARPPKLPMLPRVRVRKRGFPYEGFVFHISAVTPAWVQVAWDDGRGDNRALICHANELEVLSEPLW